jgi:hypothetical protein
MVLGGALSVGSQNAAFHHPHLRPPIGETASIEKGSIPQYADPTAWLASGSPAAEALNEPASAVQALNEPAPAAKFATPKQSVAKRIRRAKPLRTARRIAPQPVDAWTSMTLGYNEPPHYGRNDRNWDDLSNAPRL